MLSSADRVSVVEMRRRVAGLLQGVLEETLSRPQAIARWPEAAMGLAQQDESLHAAYMMLWFLESDEDQQAGEVFYLDTQLELLRVSVNYLKDGNPLPDTITREYRPISGVQFYQSGRVMDEFTGWVERFWDRCRSLYEQALNILVQR